ncbi:MAG: CARDB domain-containing protein [Candidatus Zixiibacteriota bacterium]
MAILSILSFPVFGNGSARSMALGGAFSARENDPISISKSPVAGWQYGWGFAADYSQNHLRLDDNIFEAALAATYATERFGTAVAISTGGSSMYRRFQADLPFMMKINHLRLAIAPKIILDNFDDTNFHYTNPEQFNDPVFADKTSSSGIGFSVGAMYEVENLFRTAFSISNIIQPKLGIADKLLEPMEIRGGILYDFQQIGSTISWDAAYSLDVPSEEEFIWGFGIENYGLSETFLFRGGLSSRNVNIGLGIDLPTIPDLGLDFAYSYPFAKSRDFAGQIRAGINYSIKPPVPSADLAIDCKVPQKIFKAGEIANIEASVINTGDAKSNFSNLLFEIENQTIKKEMIPAIAPSDTINFQFKVPIEDSRNISGQMIIQDETGIADRCLFKLDIAEKPNCQVHISPNEMTLNNLSYTYQDEGLVPVVFFEELESEIPERFSDLLDIIASRISNNPDISIEIKGYIAPFEKRSEIQDRELARARATNVFDELIRRNNSIKNRLYIPENWNIYDLRLPEKGLIPKQRNLYEQENRRVEIFARIDNRLDNRARMLERNPGLYLVIAADDVNQNPEDALNRAIAKMEQIKRNLPEIFHHRILPSFARMTGESNDVEEILSIDGLLYKPMIVHASRDYEPKQHPEAKINIDYSGEKIKKWQLSIIPQKPSEALNNGFLIARGDGEIPSKQSWDFRNEHGDIMTIDRRFNLELEIDDNLGQKATCIAPETIETNIDGSFEITKKLLLVQFEFDRPTPESKFLEDRLYRIAEDVIESIEKADSTWINVEGHTDIIGTIGRNQRLSDQRAVSVQENLKQAMSIKLGLEYDSLDNWLRQSGASISAEGHSSEKPYSIMIWQDGERREEVIGNNDFPEGRAINRRVMVIIHSRSYSRNYR